MTIYVDSDAFIGIESASDSLNPTAIQLLEQLKGTQFTLYTSWDVIDEVTTKLSYYLSKQQSLSFIQFLEEYNIHILYPTKERHRKAVDLFSSIPSKRVSMTDCMNMILVTELDLDCIFSFDKIYQRHGFKTLEEVVG
jgi:predicted nucleic acid-binding protein